MSNILEKDVINFNYIQIFTYYSYAIFTTTTVILLLFVYLIYICTNEKMLNYRILMFIMLFGLYGAELIVFLWQPIRLFSLDILYASGALANTSSKSFSFAACFFVVILPLFADTLELSFLERHFIIYQILYPSSAKKLRIRTYICMFITYILAVILNIIFFVNCVDDERVLKVLSTKFSNVTVIFGTHPSMLIFDSYNNLLGIIFAGIYAFSRFLIVLWIIYANLQYSKNPDYAKSENSRTEFKLMFQTTVIQLLCFSSFAIPCIVFVGLGILPTAIFDMINLHISFLTKMDFPLIYLIAYGIMMLYPFTFCILAIVFIKSYRITVIKILCKFFCKPKITSVNFFPN